MSSPTNNSNKKSGPSFEEYYKHLLGNISASQSPSSDFDKLRLSESEQTIKERETERLGKEKYYELRTFWSRMIAIAIAVVIGFQIILTFSIGLGWLTFKNYEWFLPLVLGQNILEVIGLGAIIVTFLFPSSGDSNKK